MALCSEMLKWVQPSPRMGWEGREEIKYEASVLYFLYRIDTKRITHGPCSIYITVTSRSHTYVFVCFYQITQRIITLLAKEGHLSVNEVIGWQSQVEDCSRSAPLIGRY